MNGLVGGGGNFGRTGHFSEENGFMGMRMKRGLTTALINSFSDRDSLKEALTVTPTSQELGIQLEPIKHTKPDAQIIQSPATTILTPAEPIFDDVHLPSRHKRSPNLKTINDRPIVKRSLGSFQERFVPAHPVNKFPISSQPVACVKDPNQRPVFG